MTVMKAIAAALLLATGIALVAAAQTAADFPSRPVKLLVPFAAGGPTDVVARILADLLSARWGGQSVVIENRPGAGTIVATAALAKAPADGYTMLVATNSLLINPAIGQKLPYDTEKDFALGRHPAGRARRQQIISRRYHSGIGACCEKDRAAAQLHFAGAARRRPSSRRNAQAARRHRDDPYQLQRQRARPDRLDCRAGATDVRHLALGQALRRFGRAQADRRRRWQASRRRAAGRDHRRDLSGFRRYCLQCPSCARRRARAGARQIVRRYSLGGEFGGVCGQGASSRYLSRRQHAAGTRRLDAQGDAPLG